MGQNTADGLPRRMGRIKVCCLTCTLGVLWEYNPSREDERFVVPVYVSSSSFDLAVLHRAAFWTIRTE
jgi:hypothetical protein